MRILVFLILLALCIGYVFMPIRSRNARAAQSQLKSDLHGLEHIVYFSIAVEEHIPLLGDEFIQDLVDNEQLSRKISDPWGSTYVLRLSDQFRYIIQSAGKDRKLNTSDDLSLITNIDPSDELQPTPLIAGIIVNSQGGAVLL